MNYCVQKPNSLELMNIKKFLKNKNLHFLHNNILTRLFKELKKYIRMTINNIYIIYVRIILRILMYIF